MNVSARRLGLAAAVLAAVLLGAAAACDDGGEDSAATAEATSTAAESTAAATGTATAAATAAATATEAVETATTAATAEATSEASPAAEGATVSLGGNEELGEFLVGPDGMTLYIFTNDEPGVSNCTGGCADNWPPLTVEGDVSAGEGVTGELDVIEREDGSMQVTYNGQPLYYWANDSESGDATGHEVGGVWFVARADESTASAAGGGSSGNDPGY